MTTARIFIAVVNYSDRVHCNNRAPKAELVQPLLAIEWTLATALAVVIAHLAIEIAGSAWLGYGLLFLLPLVGGILGGKGDIGKGAAMLKRIGTAARRDLEAFFGIKTFCS